MKLIDVDGRLIPFQPRSTCDFIATTAALIGAAIAASAGSVGAAAIGAHAAGSAAQTQATAAQLAAQKTAQAQQNAIGTLQSTTNQAIQGYQPYQQVGQGATTQLSQMMQPGGYLATPWSQQFTAPTLEQAQATPGYQFALQQGTGAIEASAAARGTQLNTGTMKNLMGYATGLANQTYGDVYNRSMQQYLQNYSQFQQNQQNIYSRLTGLSGIGQWATGNVGNLTAGLGRNIADVTMSGTAQQNQALQNAAAATAAGQIGTAQQWGGALGNIGNILGQGFLMGGGLLQQPGSNWGKLNVGSGQGGNLNLGGGGWGNLNVGSGNLAPLSQAMNPTLSQYQYQNPSSLNMYGAGVS